MAKKKQRRRNPKAQRNVEPELPDEYDIDSDELDNKLLLDPHGRVGLVEGGVLRILPPDLLEALGQDCELDGAFTEDIPVAEPERVYVIDEPAIRDGVACLRLGVRAVSHIEGEGLIWHPTYTARVRWEADVQPDASGWIFELVQDASPAEPFCDCALGADGGELGWDGGSDGTSVVVGKVAFARVAELLELARSLMAEG